MSGRKTARAPKRHKPDAVALENLRELHECALERRAGGFCIAACAAERAYGTFAAAFAELAEAPPWAEVRVLELGEQQCRIEASEHAWAVYWCWLSLQPGRELHPFAARLAAAFFLGAPETRAVVGRAALRWRGLDHEPRPREFLVALAALDLAAAVAPEVAASLLAFRAQHALLEPVQLPQGVTPRHALLDAQAPWAVRNQVALLWRVRDLALAEPPKREHLPIRQRFPLPAEHADLGLFARLVRALQALEGCPPCESAYAVDPLCDSWHLVGAQSALWLVL